MSKDKTVRAEKNRDYSTVSARVAAAAIIVLASFMLICFSSYAFFFSSVSSDSNIIKAANFEVDVSVRIGSEDGESVVVKSDNGNTHRADLKAGVTYYITLKRSKDSTAQTGYCMLKAKDSDEVFYTQQLSTVSIKSNGDPTTLSFHLKVSNDTTVTFDAYWGTLKSIDGKEQIITGENVDDRAIIITVNGTESTDSNGDSDTVNTDSTPEQEGESSLPDETTKTEEAPKETTEAVNTEPDETFDTEITESEQESESILETDETSFAGDTESDTLEPSDTVYQEDTDSDMSTETSEVVEKDTETISETDVESEENATVSDTSEAQSVDETT